VRGCRKLAKREGILAGASTGAIVAAIEQQLPGIEAGARIGFLVHDSGVPYLNTVYDNAWVRHNLGSEPEPDSMPEMQDSSPR
jgi:hypothetical protein